MRPGRTDRRTLRREFEYVRAAYRRGRTGDTCCGPYRLHQVAAFPDDDQIKLCRIQYLGDSDHWAFAIWQASTDSYTDDGQQ